MLFLRFRSLFCFMLCFTQCTKWKTSKWMKKILREVPAKPKASNTVLELRAVNRGLNMRLFGISRVLFYLFFGGGWKIQMGQQGAFNVFALSQWCHEVFMTEIILLLSSPCEAAKRRVRRSGSWPPMCANSGSADRWFLLLFVTPEPSQSPSACLPVAWYRRVLHSCLQPSWEIIIVAFLFLSASASDLWMERKRQGEGPDRACGLKMSRHCSPLPHSLLLSPSLSLSPHAWDASRFPPL